MPLPREALLSTSSLPHQTWLGPPLMLLNASSLRSAIHSYHYVTINLTIIMCLSPLHHKIGLSRVILFLLIFFKPRLNFWEMYSWPKPQVDLWDKGESPSLATSVVPMDNWVLLTCGSINRKKKIQQFWSVFLSLLRKTRGWEGTSQLWDSTWPQQPHPVGCIACSHLPFNLRNWSKPRTTDCDLWVSNTPESGQRVGDRWERVVFLRRGGGEGWGPPPFWNLWLFSAQETWPRWGGPQESLSLQASEPEGQAWLQ